MSRTDYNNSVTALHLRGRFLFFFRESYMLLKKMCPGQKFSASREKVKKLRGKFVKKRYIAVKKNVVSVLL